MNTVVLSHYNTPIIIDIDGREKMFDRNNHLITIYEIGDFTKEQLKQFGTPELKINEFYRLEDEIYPSIYTISYPINKVFRDDYNNINKYKSVAAIRKYEIKTNDKLLKRYLENFKTQRIRDLQDKKEVEKKGKSRQRN